MNGNVRRRFNTEADAIASHVDDRNDNIVPDIDTLILVSGQNKHYDNSF
jgi:hypothetical protein